MAYVLNALVADLEVLSRATLPVVPLAQGKGLVPLDNKFWLELKGTSQPLLGDWSTRRAPDEDFEGPSERARRIERAAASFAQLTPRAQQLSMGGPVAYLESDSWAGSGSEAAAVW